MYNFAKQNETIMQTQGAETHYPYQEISTPQVMSKGLCVSRCGLNA